MPADNSRRRLQPACFTGSLLPGAKQLLRVLTEQNVLHAIATSRRLQTARPVLEVLGVAPNFARGLVRYTKPHSIFFVAAAERFNVSIQTSVVAGHSVWDLGAAQQARALSAGLLSGGDGREQLEMSRGVPRLSGHAGNAPP
jgi:phosphoglycolate phosphatase-like HAD superfamily hydrolase